VELLNSGQQDADFAVVTVVTRSYLHYARALAASVGETGYLVPTEDCMALTDAMVQLLDVPAEFRCNMGSAATSLVESRFSRISKREAFRGYETDLAGAL
jgi:hypothetical protein